MHNGLLKIRHFKKATFASLMAMLLILTLLTVMFPFTAAHSPGGDTMNAALGSTPTIDGKWTGTEWDDANEYTITGSGGTSYLRIKHNSTHLHILIDSPWDTTNQTAYPAENTFVAIDMSHDGGGAPQTDDYLFHIGAMNAWQGTGAGWSWMAPPAGFAGMQSSSSWGPGVQPSPKNATPHRIDEMEIPLAYVGSLGSTVGFYVMVVDDSTNNYVEWPPAAGGNPMAWPPGSDPCPAPNAWGDLKLTTSAEMDAPLSPINPTIDGNWSAGEWDEAPEYTITGPGGRQSYLRIKHNSTHLHILIDSPWDTTNQTVYPFENTWVAIDTNHDHVSPPQIGDYLFHVGGMNAWQGNGTHWGWMAVPAGFASAQSGSSWGPGVQPSPKSATPHRIDEMEIPLAYVGSLGSTVGFYVMVVDDSTNNYVEWPPAAGGNPMAWPVGAWYSDPCPTSNAWGDLRVIVPGVDITNIALYVDVANLGLVQLSTDAHGHYLAFDTWTVKIQVTVHNNGIATANYTVNAYYSNATGTYPIGTSKNITNLDPCNSANVTFDWDLSGVKACSSYTVKANATNTYGASDELVMTPDVKVTIKGNVDDSAEAFPVNILDVGAVAWTMAIGGYEVLHDLNLDGAINILDVGAVAWEMAIGAQCPP